MASCSTARCCARRRARFAEEMAEHEVLLAHVAARSPSGSRDAARVPARARSRRLSWLLGRTVAELPSVGAMIYAESVPGLPRFARGPPSPATRTCCRSRTQSFNLVVSGLALHRVNDLPGALIQIRRALHPDGLFMAALLGAAAHELRQALIEAEAEIDGGASPRVAPFADVREYGALLQRAGFALPVTDAELLTVTYPSPRALMREIRTLGGGNVMAARRKMPLPRGTLERAEEIYRERQAPLRARCGELRDRLSRGWGPDASQQKPLAPGSATRASPMRCTPPSGPPATRRHFPPNQVVEGALQHVEHAADRAADLADHSHDGDGDQVGSIDGRSRIASAAASPDGNAWGSSSPNSQRSRKAILSGSSAGGMS